MELHGEEGSARGGRPSRGRMEIPPIIFRLSPAERRDLVEKTALAGLRTMSEGIREALYQWAPKRMEVLAVTDGNVLKKPESRELTVAYDE